MNYTSLLALCSLMLLVPSCGKSGNTPTSTQTDIKVEPSADGSSVEIKEETTASERTAAEKDKENLEEAELTEVVVKK